MCLLLRNATWREKGYWEKWTEKYIRECSIRNSQELDIENDSYYYDISLINSSEELFKPECDYSINVKFSMHTKELIKEIKDKIRNRNLDMEQRKELIGEIIDKNEYDSRKIEEIKIRNKENTGP